MLLNPDASRACRSVCLVACLLEIHAHPDLSLLIVATCDRDTLIVNNVYISIV